MLKALDIAWLSRLVHLFSVALGSGIVHVDWQTRMVCNLWITLLWKGFPFLMGTTQQLADNTTLESLCLGAVKDVPADCQILDSGGTMQIFHPAYETVACEDT